jgi:hypothetical protein
VGKNVSPQMRVAHDRASWYIQFLLKVADSSLSQNAKAADRGKKFFTRNDIAVINMGKEHVERDAPNLVKILLSLPVDDAHQALILLQGSLSGAFEIGTRCAHKVRDEAKTEIMRETREPITAARNVTLDAAIIDMSKYLNKKLAVSMNFARLIRPGVRELLGLTHNEKGWPSESAIKEAISKRIKLQELSSRRAKTSRTVLM